MNGPYLALVLGTGPRSCSDVRTIEDALLETWHDARQDGYSGIEVMEGGATGADSIIRHWAKVHVTDGVGHQQVDADWAGPCAGICPPGHRRNAHGHTYCPLAGHRRNQHMVNAGPAVVLAFIGPCTRTTCPKPKPHGTHGTANCAELAKKTGIPVRRFEVAA